MKPVGIARFLGTNCDRDVWQAVESLGMTPRWLWHEDQFDVNDYSAYIVPGGFSHGDYLRCGALAAKAPVMKSVTEAAAKGAPVLGICNGFQILCEARLLPGVLVRNESRKFIDKWVTLRPAGRSVWLKDADQSLRLPIAHGEGRFHSEPEVLQSLADKGQVWLTYEENPNGSLRDIAGITNEKGNVAGLMPHPERAVNNWMGGEDGRRILEAVLS